MATPPTVSAAGYFAARRAGTSLGEATLLMSNSTSGSLRLSGRQYAIEGDPAAKRLHGTSSGSTLDLRIKTRSLLTGTLDGAVLELTRNVLRPIPAAELAQHDPGPTGPMKAVLDATPDYKTAVGDSTTFWYAFGPVLYRGRLDGSARVLGIASDPGPSECLPFARRTLVGDSGQKTQGFLAKLGLTRSYVLVNAFAVALHPGKKTKGLQVLRANAEIQTSRQALYNALLASGSLQAIVAFGDVAHVAYDLWAASNAAVAGVPVFKVSHPAAVDRTGSGDDAALKQWKQTVTALRAFVTPDSDGTASGPNYGSYFTETDYVRIPRWDFPSVTPAYIGDDSWGRAANPRHNNCCERPSPDDNVSLLLTPPSGQGEFLQYVFNNGRLAGAKSKTGTNVSVDEFGMRV